MPWSSLKSLLKTTVLTGLGSSAVVARKLDRIKRSRALTVLNLHRVCPHDGSTYPPLDPLLFEQLLRFVQRHYRTTTFAELAGEPDAGGKPPLVLSFDDAYRDFADIAMPLLAKYRIRVNQNVIPGCVDSGRPPLNVILQDFVGRAPDEALRRLDIPGLPPPLTGEPRGSAGHRISAFVKAKPMAEQQRLAPYLVEQMAREADFAPTPVMTVEQLREAAAEHEIGVHSFDHASMGEEDDDYFRADLQRCRAWLHDTLDLPLTVYAFPNGSHRPSQVEILRREGVSSILLVDEDFTYRRDGTYRRFTFDARSPAEVRFRATGAWKQPVMDGGAW